MFPILAKLLKVLNSEQSPGQIAAAISLAAIIGITPLMSLHNLIVIFIVLFFRVNLSVFLVAWPLFIGLGILVSPLAESIGLTVLQADGLVDFWASFYNTLIGRWSNFYYSGVIGSLIIALGVAVTLYPISVVGVKLYRSKFMQRIEQYKIVKVLKATKLWHAYEKLS